MTERDLPEVRAIMARAVRCRNSAIQTCVDSLMANPGKLLRPRLVLLSWHIEQQAGGAMPAVSDPKILRLAAAVEILHMATLVHDDVIDRAETRRSQVSVYAAYGARTAILVGDLLFSAAFQLVADLAEPRLAAILAAAIRVISESEIMQMQRIDPEHPVFRQYLHQIIGKTAVLFAMSCRAGAELAGADSATIQNLQRGGYDLGMAFQVIDDILDFSPNDQKTGKTPGRDLELGLLTLPVLAALKQVAPHSDNGRALRNLLVQEHFSLDDLGRVRDLLVANQGFDTAREWAARYTRRALREFGKLAESSARTELIGLATELLQRQY